MFAAVVGFIREHPASSTDLCPVRYRFPGHSFPKLTLLQKLVCDARKKVSRRMQFCMPETMPWTKTGRASNTLRVAEGQMLEAWLGFHGRHTKANARSDTPQPKLRASHGSCQVCNALHAPVRQSGLQVFLSMWHRVAAKPGQVSCCWLHATRQCHA